MFLGLRTVTYHVGDLDRAKEWYGRGFELGLQPDEPGVPRSSTGVIAYWGVEDAAASHARLLELGAKEYGGVRDVGGNILVATVVDPFDNVFGVVENPRFSPKTA